MHFIDIISGLKSGKNYIISTKLMSKMVNAL